MNKAVALSLALVMVVSSSALVGCQTAGGSAGSGALIGASVGALIGSGSGNAAKGALIGAVVGTATGLIVHDVKSRRSRTAQETVEEYRYVPSMGERMTFESARVSPTPIRRGGQVEASAQYAILGTNGGVQVTETWILRRGQEEISKLSSYKQTRNDGTWVSTLPFRVPDNLAPGDYRIFYTAATSQTSISGSSTLVVR